ncbi:MAG: alginate lyase family protein [Bacteroidetes bacterium]|nr:alginate lyase family protein [Bacteroidota bacterium]MBU1117035.1 alginate lyase family protein [Bacteroidota bacterium]MBU1797630.1 alginate lyase family protein [Bacteroidota bacterium]
MNKIILKIIFASIFLISLSFGQTLNLFDYSTLEKIKESYIENGNYQKEIDNLNMLANIALKEAPYTITKYSAPKIEGASVNDYYSDSPYWWPVEGDSLAPYIRKDGERNPDRFMNHKNELAKFYKGLFALAFYSYFTNNMDYGKQANNILRVWFIDEATKMNPNLKYSQLIRNKTNRRGVGIIDGRRLAVLTEAIILLKMNNQLEEDVYSGIQKWYADFFIWLTTSYYGLDEMNRGNNHGTWWTYQVASLSSILKNTDMIVKLGEHSKHFLLDNQIDENARQPLEEERTRSLSYSIFNLTAHSFLNSILLKNNIDNWNYINENGVTLINVIDYLIPFVKEPSSWKIKQIKSIDNSGMLFLALAGLELNNIKYLKLYDELSNYEESELNKSTFDPIQIVLDSIVKFKINEYEK